LNDAGVPAGEINNIGQAFENPQVKHLGLAQPVKSHERGDTHLVGQPIMMSRTPSHIASPPPLAGGHADDILSTLGYSAEDIAALRDAKTI
jgi:crotonobetainyl-CoA:carnitine CoA-transferase CaiB-like acyl-CoA transferase